MTETVKGADPPFDFAQVDRLLTTTKAVRRRLDLGRPVPRNVITECIRLASYTPSASNSQEWHWVVADDAELRREVGEQYRSTTEAAVTTMLAAKEAAGDEAGAQVSRSVLYLAEHMVDVPTIVIPCYDLAAATERYGRLLDPERAPTSMEPAMLASILPSVWSFQLALRSRGLGSTLTTAPRQIGEDGEDPRHPGLVVSGALIPVAYTTGGDFKPSPHASVDDAIVWNRAALR